MTFAELQNEVIMSRFDEHRRDSVKMWINHRYAQVNGMTAWPWKYPAVAGATWAEGTEYEALSPQAGRLLDVIDLTNGTTLTFMEFPEFSNEFLVDGVDTSGTAPVYWTVQALLETRLLRIHPRAAVELQFVINETPVMMVADSDEPVWPEEYHFSLVLGAIATGLKVENDPTWEALEVEFNSLVAAMKDDVLPANVPSNRQYGRDMLGYEWE